MNVTDQMVNDALAAWYGRGDWKSMFYPISRARMHNDMRWNEEHVAVARDAMKRALLAALSHRAARG